MTTRTRDHALEQRVAVAYQHTPLAAAVADLIELHLHPYGYRMGAMPAASAQRSVSLIAHGVSITELLDALAARTDCTWQADEQHLISFTACVPRGGVPALDDEDRTLALYLFGMLSGVFGGNGEQYGLRTYTIARDPTQPYTLVLRFERSGRTFKVAITPLGVCAAPIATAQEDSA